MESTQAYSDALRDQARTQHELLRHSWPPVPHFSGCSPEFAVFLDMDPLEKSVYLKRIRDDGETHGRFVHESLAVLYGYQLGYVDSPLFLEVDDEVELKLMAAKFALEDELRHHWLRVSEPPLLLEQSEAADYLRGYSATNDGVVHPFFEYVACEMPRDQVLEFLLLEAVRNEVVDDEVAWIVVGLQGFMKKVMAENLWDECGNGVLENFHTHWLRRMLDHFGKSATFANERLDVAPWFPKVTSNTFNMMATRPGFKYRAFGAFVITESWVAPHFERILEGMRRVGLYDEDAAIYFDKHINIDPFHTEAMLVALESQVPKLSTREISEVLWGAHSAVTAGHRSYEIALAYFARKGRNV